MLHGRLEQIEAPRAGRPGAKGLAAIGAREPHGLADQPLKLFLGIVVPTAVVHMVAHGTTSCPTGEQRSQPSEIGAFGHPLAVEQFGGSFGQHATGFFPEAAARLKFGKGVRERKRQFTFEQLCGQRCVTMSVSAISLGGRYQQLKQVPPQIGRNHTGQTGQCVRQRQTL